MDRRLFIAGLPVLLAGCAAESVWAPDDVVARATWRHDGPPLLTLFTMKETSNGAGAHTGLMVNASQRVIFDPAGTFSYPTLPERNDVHFGITPEFEDFYISYHARETYYVLRQDIPVSAAGAETALRALLGHDPVSQGFCTMAASKVMAKVPELPIRPTFFPDRLVRQVAALPDVTAREFREDDPDDKTLAFEAFHTTRVSGD